MQVLRKILFPISLLYAMVVHLRNFFYDKGIFKSKAYGTPIICVGNLSVGGTGKTPMIEFLVSELSQEFKLAVLSRGYRRKSKGFLLANKDMTVEALGDEPFQIYSKFHHITVAVDADRQNGISILENKISPDLILLDDAFQHRRVKPNLSILLTAYGNLYTDDCYLPTGSLRDSRYAAKRAKLIIVTKCPSNLTAQVRNSIIRRLKPKSYQHVLFSYLAYDNLLKGIDKDVPLEKFKDKKITLVTGIANPEPLVAYLKKEGIDFNHLRFKDHHFFTEKELAQLQKRNCIVTTEKDYVRLKDSLKNLYYILIRHNFIGDDKEVLDHQLKEIMKPDF